MRALPANGFFGILLHLGIMLAQGSYQLRTHDEFLALLHRFHDGLIVVDYFSHSCPPCKMMAPVFDRLSLSPEYAGRVQFAKVDVYENSVTTSKMGITGMPTFQFFMKGQMVHSFSCTDENQLRAVTTQFASQVRVSQAQKSPKETQASVPQKQASVPQKQASVPQKQASVPQKQASVPQKQAPVPQKQAPVPQRQAPQQQAPVPPVPQNQVPVAPADNDSCRAKRRQADGRHIEQVVIVGSGPAGTSAALYAGRSGLCPLVIAPTVGGQLLAKGVDVENYPGLPSGTGASMIDSMRKQAHGFSAEFVDDAVEFVDTSVRPFSIRMKGGKTTLSHTVIVATGAVSRWLGVDGEEEYKGRGVSGCATCDGFLFKGKRCAVIGGGDTAMEEALVLSRLCSSVAVIHRRGQFRASKVLQDRLLADPKITVFYNRGVVKFLGDGALLRRLHLRDTTKPKSAGSFLDLDAAFVAIGRDPNTFFLKNSLRTDSQGYLEVIAGSTRTSVTGIFAAGDVADHTYRQAITSAASGAMAAMDVEKYFSGAAEASAESPGICSYIKDVLSGSFQLGCIGAMLSSTRL